MASTASAVPGPVPNFGGGIQYTESPWTGTLDSEARQNIIDILHSKCHSLATLMHAGYRMISQQGYKPSPAPRNGAAKRLAVALDCEMARTEAGNECVQLCAVDILTGERIVDTGVFPVSKVISWNTRWSGMSWPKLKAMQREGKTVKGWTAARSELFRFIDSETVLVGHSLENDLKCLGIIHERVVDTALLTKDAAAEHLGGDCNRKWALKKLSAAFLNMPIQQSSSGHDCMEDTLATREVLLFCLQRPDLLDQWAVEAAIEEERAGNRVGGCSGPSYESVDDFL